MAPDRCGTWRSCYACCGCVQKLQMNLTGFCTLATLDESVNKREPAVVIWTCYELPCCIHERELQVIARVLLLVGDSGAGCAQIAGSDTPGREVPTLRSAVLHDTSV